MRNKPLTFAKVTMFVVVRASWYMYVALIAVVRPIIEI